MRLIASLAAALVVMAGAFFGAPSASGAPEHLAVSISNFAFSPSALSIHAGDMVTWTNHDVAPHDVTVTSGPAAIHSPTLSTGQSWSYTFTAVGTYRYICSVHPDMHATLTVAAAPTPTSSVPPAQPSAGSHASTPAARPQVVSATPVTHAATSSAAPSSAAPTSAASTTAAAAPVAAPPSTGSTSRSIKPLLLIAGLVAAVATFCLLLLASRPDEAAPES